MGVLLDTTVVVRAERLRWSEAVLLRMVVDVVGDEELGISSIALAELLHGIYREARGEMREGRC